MTKKYHFWISGCQMNYADARQVANQLEDLGYSTTDKADDADQQGSGAETRRQDAGVDGDDLAAVTIPGRADDR